MDVVRGHRRGIRRVLGLRRFGPLERDRPDQAGAGAARPRARSARKRRAAGCAGNRNRADRRRLPHQALRRQEL